MPAKEAKETRDLHSKAWQLGAKQKIVRFLAEHHYKGNEVSVKTLDGPTQKEFFSIAGYLFRHILPDAPAQLTNDSASIDYILTTLSLMGYQPPSKSALQAVSSPLHWPSMLGLLDWLTTAAEVLVHRRDYSDPDMVQKPVPVEQQDWQAADHLDDEDFVNDLLLSAYQAEREALHEEGTALQHEVTENIQRLRACEASSNAVAELHEEQLLAASRIKCLQEEAEAFKAKLQWREQELEALKERDAEAEQCILAAQADVARVEAQVERQPMDKATALNLESRRAEWQEERKLAAHHVSAMQTRSNTSSACRAERQKLARRAQEDGEEAAKQHTALESALEEELDALSNQLRRYNRAIEDARLNGGNGSALSGDYEIRLDRGGRDADSLCSGVSIQDVVWPAVLKARKGACDAVEQLGDDAKRLEHENTEQRRRNAMHAATITESQEQLAQVVAEEAALAERRADELRRLTATVVEHKEEAAEVERAAHARLAAADALPYASPKALRSLKAGLKSNIEAAMRDYITATHRLGMYCLDAQQHSNKLARHVHEVIDGVQPRRDAGAAALRGAAAVLHEHGRDADVDLTEQLTERYSKGADATGELQPVESQENVPLNA